MIGRRSEGGGVGLGLEIAIAMGALEELKGCSWEVLSVDKKALLRRRTAKLLKEIQNTL